MLSQRAGFHSFSWLKDSSVCVSVYIKYIFGVYVYLYLYIDREDAVCIYIYIFFTQSSTDRHLGHQLK